MMQAYARWISREMLYGFRKSAGPILRDRITVKRDAQIVPHRLHPLVVFALEPRQNRVPRKIVDPPFERLGQLNAQLLGLMEHRRSRVRREDVSPEFRAGEFLADVHHEIHG